jgi:hypothetical protein
MTARVRHPGVARGDKATADMTERISLFDGYASSSCHDQRGCWASLAIGGRTLTIVVGAGGHAEADCESGG